MARVQLHRGFTFDDAARIVPYLADLGVSHLYCSPYQESVPGSTHGYDVVDPTRVSAERGGEEGLRRLVTTLRAAGMGHIVDIVPNHMASDLTHNRWWRDVLEHGQASRWAPVFDVDWRHLEPRRRSRRVLLPVLGDHYGRVLDGGGLGLVRSGGEVQVAYGELTLPVSPQAMAGLLGSVATAAEARPLAEVAEEFSLLSESRRPDSGPLRAQLAELLDHHPELARRLDDHLAAVSGDGPGLDAVLRHQHYRLAFWRVAAQELDYRRFFDVNDLVAVRVEDPQVFEATHELVGRLVAEGLVDGVRVDHVDGLRDPAGYLRSLRALVGPDAYVVVEKILGRHEGRRPWPVAGTTGYEVANDILGVFVDPRGEVPLTELYHGFTGADEDFATEARQAKREVLAETLAADVNRLVDRLADIRDQHYRAQDFTRRDLRDALRALAATFTVYRTYVRPGAAPRGEDVAALEGAIAEAAAEGIEGELLAFLREVLLRRLPGTAATDIALRFQQLTGATMAKGVEDTAFYRYLRLAALDEVGGDPGTFARSVDDLHRANAARVGRWGASMVTTATHDTKRGEDTRLRIALIAEVPDAWARAVHRWSARAEAHRQSAGPDRRDEYLLYQTLVGTWPITPERLTAYLLKAAREAKRRTTWTEPDEAYEAALAAFAASIVDDVEVVAELEALLAVVVPAARTASLAQTALKLTVPGVPDLYPGTETWDLTLVDPDNRRPVDHDALAALAGEVAEAEPEAVLARAGEGAPKLWLLRRVLGLRARRPDCFAPGAAYGPLVASGRGAAHLVAYRRGPDVAVLVPRLVLGLGGGWGDTNLDLPPGRWANALDGAVHDVGPAAGGLGVGAVLDRFPVAVLERR